MDAVLQRKLPPTAQWPRTRGLPVIHIPQSELPLNPPSFPRVTITKYETCCFRDISRVIRYPRRIYISSGLAVCNVGFGCSNIVIVGSKPTRHMGVFPLFPLLHRGLATGDVEGVLVNVDKGLKNLQNLSRKCSTTKGNKSA